MNTPPTISTDREQDDQKLITALRQGHREAFSQMVKQYQGPVYGYLRARLLEPADAEDMCQEVFLRCFLGRDKLDEMIQLHPWLIGIARNLLRENIRKVKRRKEVAWTELCLELDSMTSEENMPFCDAKDYLPDCIGSLGESAQEALNLRYHAQMRLAEISNKLKRSVGAVKLLMFRARQALKNCLDLKTKKQ